MSPEPVRPSHESQAPEPCSVPGCGGDSVRHLALTEAKKAFPDLPDKGRRAPLCRNHYKQWKKETKESRDLARLGR